MKKDYPITEFDPAREALIEPSKRHRPVEIPVCCIACFFQDEIVKLQRRGRLRVLKKLKSEMGTHLVYAMRHNEQEIALFQPGVGGPLAATLLEEVIALGCRKFMACGGAGVLDGSIAMGELLVVTAAVRDEGTSYHYLPPAREVAASPAAVLAAQTNLSDNKIPFKLVKTWTTDAPYRETPEKIALRRSEGCLAVEMEAAAMFAVAEFRGMEIGQLLYAGDDLSGDKWQSRGWVRNSVIREKLIFLAAEACLKMSANL